MDAALLERRRRAIQFVYGQEPLVEERGGKRIVFYLFDAQTTCRDPDVGINLFAPEIDHLVLAQTQIPYLSRRLSLRFEASTLSKEETVEVALDTAFTSWTRELLILYIANWYQTQAQAIDRSNKELAAHIVKGIEQRGENLWSVQIQRRL